MEQYTFCSKNTILHSAIKTKNFAATRFILSECSGFCWINTQNAKGETPLHWAAEHGPIATVELLIYHGAQLDIVDQDHNTALHWAAVHNQKAIFDHLQHQMQRKCNNFNQRDYTEGTCPEDPQNVAIEVTPWEKDAPNCSHPENNRKQYIDIRSTMPIDVPVRKNSKSRCSQAKQKHKSFDLRPTKLATFATTSKRRFSFL